MLWDTTYQGIVISRTYDNHRTRRVREIVNTMGIKFKAKDKKEENKPASKDTHIAF